MVESTGAYVLFDQPHIELGVAQVVQEEPLPSSRDDRGEVTSRGVSWASAISKQLRGPRFPGAVQAPGASLALFQVAVEERHLDRLRVHADIHGASLELVGRQVCGLGGFLSQSPRLRRGRRQSRGDIDGVPERGGSRRQSCLVLSPQRMHRRVDGRSLPEWISPAWFWAATSLACRSDAAARSCRVVRPAGSSKKAR